MCGILAVANFDGSLIDQTLLYTMRDTMIHRGPDDAGIYIEKSVGLAHRRLSIIDLTPSGRQPMANSDNSIIISFNGEIYNYIELKKDLLSKGYNFVSNSDTEVILNQYLEDGEDCLEKLNGMFAFVIFDKNKKRLFVARDRFGIKPLFYYIDPVKLIIASEIKAILADPQVVCEMDNKGVADYLFAGRPLGEKTLFKGILELPPAHIMTINIESGEKSLKKYWDLEYDYNFSRTLEETTDALFSLMDDAVKIHCRSDASIGSHLSGGVDSSTVVGFAARHKSPLKTFSIRFTGDSSVDESQYASLVASHVDTEYFEKLVGDKEMASLYPKLIWHTELPIGNGSYYVAAKLAREHVKVSLTGHGGDELFAGYPAQFMAAFGNTDMFAPKPSQLDYMPAKNKIMKLLSGHYQHKQIFNKFKKMFSMRPHNVEKTWIDLHCSCFLEDSWLWNPDFIKDLKGYSPVDEYISSLNRKNGANILDKYLYHDLFVYLPTLLHYEDRASMAVSLESRLPLLDYRIAEFLATVPMDIKVNGLIPKYLLRAIGSKLLPAKIVQRKDKFPFPVPRHYKPPKYLVDTFIADNTNRNSLMNRIFNKKIVDDLESSKVTYGHFLNLHLWNSIFIEKTLKI